MTMTMTMTPTMTLTMTGLKKNILALMLLSTLSWACTRNEAPYKQRLYVKAEPVEIQIMRYDKAFFEADTNDFANAMTAISKDYALFLNGDLSDPEVLEYLRGFATDPFARILYQKVVSKYPDNESITKLLEDVIARINHYYPEKKLSGKVYTCILGLDQFNSPVFFDNDNNLIISLDFYLDNDEVYAKVGMPQYRSMRTYNSYMARDVAKEYYDTYISEETPQGNLLDEMVKSGKSLFFAEITNPDTPDTVLLGYTENQLTWMKESEGEVWRDIVGNNKLYASQRELFMMMLNDGPFTQQYSYDAPSRIGEYIGLQIVRSYMNRNETDLQTLLGDKDLQGIFNESGYRPK